MAAAAFPLEAPALTATCANLYHAASGGTLLLTDVEHTPDLVQDRLIETFTYLDATRKRSGGVRLIAGTTTVLHERVAAGTFSERLFYRLNVIHIVVRDALGVGSPSGNRVGKGTPLVG